MLSANGYPKGALDRTEIRAVEEKHLEVTSTDYFYPIEQEHIHGMVYLPNGDVDMVKSIYN